MGMYDTFIVKEFRCPVCKEISKNEEFQTKELMNSMLVFFEDEKAIASNGPVDIVVKDGEISVLGGCSKCHKFFYGDATVEHGIFVGVFNLREEQKYECNKKR